MTDIARRKVSVCICTFKRPELLKRSLEEVAKQRLQEDFTFSIVVADNDGGRSAEPVVADFRRNFGIEITYCVEPVQNIALARNRALENAKGDFVAFIDDDEFPSKDWLLTLLRTREEHKVAGVLGPVKPFFEYEPPRWLTRGNFCDRPEHLTGSILDWRETRTGNVLFKREILQQHLDPFKPEFGGGGEDQDFFRRMIQEGHQFIWCNEAIVFEVVPPERWKRRYLLRRAFLRGQNEQMHLSVPSVAKSLVAVPLYAFSLPVLFLIGQDHFMKFAIRLMDHTGKLLAALGIRMVGKTYLS